MNILITAVVFAIALFTGAQQEKPQDKAAEKTSCPMHEQRKAPQEAQHHQGVVERGDQVMGFSHEKTAHHFRLYADGGAIEAESNDAQDTASRDEIRGHFAHIATMFAAGEFSVLHISFSPYPPLAAH